MFPALKKMEEKTLQFLQGNKTDGTSTLFFLTVPSNVKFHFIKLFAEVTEVKKLLVITPIPGLRPRVRSVTTFLP